MARFTLPPGWNIRAAWEGVSPSWDLRWMSAGPGALYSTYHVTFTWIIFLRHCSSFRQLPAVRCLKISSVPKGSCGSGQLAVGSWRSLHLILHVAVDGNAYLPRIPIHLNRKRRTENENSRRYHQSDGIISQYAKSEGHGSVSCRPVW